MFFFVSNLLVRSFIKEMKMLRAVVTLKASQTVHVTRNVENKNKTRERSYRRVLI